MTVRPGVLVALVLILASAGAAHGGGLPGAILAGGLVLLAAFVGTRHRA